LSYNPSYLKKFVPKRRVLFEKTNPLNCGKFFDKRKRRWYVKKTPIIIGGKYQYMAHESNSITTFFNRYDYGEIIKIHVQNSETFVNVKILSRVHEAPIILSITTNAKIFWRGHFKLLN
jgi:hypothetical protein